MWYAIVIVKVEDEICGAFLDYCHLLLEKIGLFSLFLVGGLPFLQYLVRWFFGYGGYAIDCGGSA